MRTAGFWLVLLVLMAVFVIAGHGCFAVGDVRHSAAMQRSDFRQEGRIRELQRRFVESHLAAFRFLALDDPSERMRTRDEVIQKIHDTEWNLLTSSVHEQVFQKSTGTLERLVSLHGNPETEADLSSLIARSVTEYEECMRVFEEKSAKRQSDAAWTREYLDHKSLIANFLFSAVTILLVVLCAVLPERSPAAYEMDEENLHARKKGGHRDPDDSTPGDEEMGESPARTD